MPRYAKIHNIKPKDHSEIIVARGRQDMLSRIYDLAPSTICKWLKGYYSDLNPNPLIDIVRARAKKMQNGQIVFIARARDRSLQAFFSKPRRNVETGRWHDPVDEYNGIEEMNIDFNEQLLPDGCNPTWQNPERYDDRAGNVVALLIQEISL